MGKFLKNLLLYMLITYFVLNIVNGFSLPTSPLYLIATLAILSVGMLMVSPILSFLTIRENFLTNFLMTFLIMFGFNMLLKIFMTGFSIEEYVFSGFEMGSLVINSFIVIPMITIALCSLLISFISALFSVLDRN